MLCLSPIAYFQRVYLPVALCCSGPMLRINSSLLECDRPDRRNVPAQHSTIPRVEIPDDPAVELSAVHPTSIFSLPDFRYQTGLATKRIKKKKKREVLICWGVITAFITLLVAIFTALLVLHFLGYLDAKKSSQSISNERLKSSDIIATKSSTLPSPVTSPPTTTQQPITTTTTQIINTSPPTSPTTTPTITTQNTTTKSSTTQKLTTKNSLALTTAKPSLNRGYCATLGEFQCDNGYCIPAAMRCNRKRNCINNEDEKGCTCSDYLPEFRKCDRVPDCQNQHDENFCNAQCRSDEFRCESSGICIPTGKVCDMQPDCPNQEDEGNFCWKLYTQANFRSDAKDINLHYNSTGYLSMTRSGVEYAVCTEGWRLTYSRDICLRLGFSRSLVTEANILPRYSGAFLKLRPSASLMVPRLRSEEFELSQFCFENRAVHISCSDLTCGQAPKCQRGSKRVVGGRPAGFGCYPWAVALYKDGELNCQAVLLNDTWLLTAAHCIAKNRDRHWVARLGFYRQKSSSPYELTREITGVIIHPNYSSVPIETNDIALVRMDRPVEFGDHVRPPCLPQNDFQIPRFGDSCTVIGWGFRHENGRKSADDLQQADLFVISQATCNDTDQYMRSLKRQSHLCLQGQDKDACQGDSGGALMCNDVNGHPYLAGITSTGYGCARSSVPGIWTPVAPFKTWIETMLKEAPLRPDANSFILPVRDRAPCEPGGFRCRLGDCIYNTLRCNMQVNCMSDFSDEKGCDSF